MGNFTLILYELMNFWDYLDASLDAFIINEYKMYNKY